MSFECPHCDNEIDTVGRTGEKRYTCSSCSKVLKYDDYVAPNLDNLEVVDKRGNSNKEEEESSVVPDQQPEEPPQPSLNEREIVQQRGREGLREVKEERLSNWLSMTDGVGGTTENRIIMVFNSDKTYRENPNALYNLLDEELSSSASYINTIVNQVFAPEEEYKDMLEDKGFRSYFQDNNANSNQQYSQPHNSQGPTMSGSNMQNQGYQNQNGGQQGQPQQPQQNQGGDSMTREEAVELVASAAQADQGNNKGFGQTASEGLNQATEEAIQNLATNAGGFFGAGQKFIEEALIGYAQKNPEKIVENMDMFQTLMNMNEEDSEPQISEQDQKVDDAVNQAMNQSSPSNQQTQQFQQPNTTTQDQAVRDPDPNHSDGGQLRSPRRNSQGSDQVSDSQKHATDESGFEPDSEILGESAVNQEKQEDDIHNDSSNDSYSSSDEEEDTYGELFGDLVED